MLTLPINRFLSPLASAAMPGYWWSCLPDAEASSVVKAAIVLAHRAISSRTGSSGHAKSFLSQGFKGYWMFLTAVTDFPLNLASLLEMFF